MSIDALKSQLPDYAKDLKLNLSSLINAPEGLTPQQLWGSLLAAAIASRNAELTRQMQAAAAEHLDEKGLFGVRAAAAVMGMNNIYYRFTHLAKNDAYGQMPAKLRMNVMMNPGVDKATFELWSFVVSVINGGGGCIDAHARQLLEKGLNKEAIQFAAKLAAVVHAIAVTLDYEQATAAAPSVS